MSYSTARLTLYALISAIELDLRALLIHALGGRRSDETYNEELRTKLERRFRDTYGSESAIAGDLAEFTDFAESYGVLNANKSQLLSEEALVITKSTGRLDKLTPIRNRVMHSRPLEPEDFAFTLDLAAALVGDSKFWPATVETLNRLRDDPAFILKLDLPPDPSKMLHNLPVPDFDETGFIGRKKDIELVKQHCLGPYPVITLIGEGGAGKTAIALRVAYDLLDDPNSPFDAIVWTSSKTTQLTSTEITRIHGAISDSLGVFSSINEYLGGDVASDPIDEVLGYLSAFKILLILDNLETVLDDRVRHFLQRLPSGSKVLLTSRIGVGAFEFPYRLSPMDNKEATRLLRTVATNRRVNILASAEQVTLSKCCDRLNNNPGFIKWFVAVVQAGVRPEDALANTNTFLNFCLDNVYRYLGEDARTLVQTMLVVPGQHTQAVLVYLSALPVPQVQAGLQELMPTSMVQMQSRSVGSALETAYDLSETARQYLSQLVPATSDVQKAIRYRKTQLGNAHQKLTSSQSGNPYSKNHFAIRSRSDIVVAKLLIDALERSQKDNHEEARHLVNQARALAPDYFEVYRVNAWVLAHEGLLPAAQSQYEMAIELEPTSPTINYWFAGFLMRNGDVAEALHYMAVAERLDPKSIDVRIEYARAFLISRDFSEAGRRVRGLLDNADIQGFHRRQLLDLQLQLLLRVAHAELEDRSVAAALDHLAQFQVAFDAIPIEHRDVNIAERQLESFRIARSCRHSARLISDMDEALRLMRWSHPTSEQEEHIGLSKGEVVRLPHGKAFGFLKSEEGVEYFFHRSAFRHGGDWMMLAEGVPLRFNIGENAQGACAVDVSVAM